MAFSKIKRNLLLNPLTPNDHYSCRTAPLTSKRCILYIYSTNIGTAYFNHGICSPFFSLQNAVCFIILTYLVPALFTFYIQVVLKLKKNNSGAKRLIKKETQPRCTWVAKGGNCWNFFVTAVSLWSTFIQSRQFLSPCRVISENKHASKGSTFESTGDHIAQST